MGGMSHSLPHVTPSSVPSDAEQGLGDSAVVTEVSERRAPGRVGPGITVDLTDEELVVRAQGGDAGAFSDLIQRHLPTCLKRAFGMLRNHCDAEDEVQNACAKAFENLKTFRSEGPFSAWLCRIVHNQCLMRLRESRNVSFFYVDATTEANSRLELVNQTPDPEENLGAEQVNTLLHREISHVPPLMRGVLVLREIDDLPMPEVAARLGLSLPAAKSRLMRARQEMRSRLGRHCGASGPRTLTSKPAPLKAEYTYIS